MRFLQLIFILIISVVSFGQSYLNDTTSFGGVSCRFSSAFEVDSGFYLMADRYSAGHGNMMEIVLGFVNENGFTTIKVDFDTLNIQKIYSGVNKLVHNERGNFVFCYKNCDTALCYPRIKEFTPAGNLVADIKFDYLIDSLGVSIYDFGDFIQKKDSTYVVISNTALPGNGTLLYIHLDSDFNLLDTIYFVHPSSQWNYGSANTIDLPNGNTLIGLDEARFLPAQEGGVRFVEVDQNDNIIKEGLYIYENKMILPLGLCNSTSGDGYLFTYTERFMVNTDDKYLMKVIKLDTNYQLTWVKNIRNDIINTPTLFLLQQEIIPIFDGNYVLVGAFTHPDFTNTIGTAQIIKFNDQGDFLWQRNHYLTEGVNSAIEIRDVIQSSDSGFVMTGMLHDLQESRQKGYIVKTNCLGFMGEPTASASHLIDEDFNVEFYNSSMQAGSYTWYFGDGDSLLTNEYIDTISHSYTDFGPSTGSGTNAYEVTLIAHGCSGVRDTINFWVSPNGDIDTVIQHGNGYFSIFPNPVLSGSDLYIYLNGLDLSYGDIYMNLYTSTGRLAQRIPLTVNEGTYKINSTLATGVYILALYQGDTFLEKGKLIVE
jgi:hypothetical protein